MTPPVSKSKLELENIIPYDIEDHCWKNVVEECCFDWSLLSHKIDLLDLHHKYADVMHLDEVLAHPATIRTAEGVSAAAAE